MMSRLTPTVQGPSGVICEPVKTINLCIHLYIFMYRVRGAIVNSEEFASAFNCKEGSSMNPKDKFELW